MGLITVSSTAKNALKRVFENVTFQRFASTVLEDCAISFTLRGNALEGFEFEIPEPTIVDTDPIVNELVAEANKL